MAPQETFSGSTRDRKSRTRADDELFFKTVRDRQFTVQILFLIAASVRIAG
jgi:hypothetical protein